MYLRNVQLLNFELLIIQIDALVLEKAITENPVLLPEDDEEQITIRVRSSTKTISYRLGKVSISSLCNFILDCRDEPILVLQVKQISKFLGYLFEIHYPG